VGLATLVSWPKDADCAWLVSRAKIFLSKLPANGETSSGIGGSGECVAGNQMRLVPVPARLVQSLDEGASLLRHKADKRTQAALVRQASASMRGAR
jgi:hypothetical protein